MAVHPQRWPGLGGANAAFRSGWVMERRGRGGGKPAARLDSQLHTGHSSRLNPLLPPQLGNCSETPS